MVFDKSVIEYQELITYEFLRIYNKENILYCQYTQVKIDYQRHQDSHNRVMKLAWYMYFSSAHTPLISLVT